MAEYGNHKRAAAIAAAVLLSAAAAFAAGESEKAAAGIVETPTIDWLAYATYGQPDPESAIVKAVEAKYRVKFNFWFINDETWSDSLNVQLAAGDMPDVLRLKKKNDLAAYVKQGIAAELPRSALELSAPDYLAAVAAVDPEGLIAAATMLDGKNYGFAQPVPAIHKPVVVWRDDWLKKVGVPAIPKTLAEAEKALYAFRNSDPDGNGKQDTYGLSSNGLITMMGAFGKPGINAFRGNPLPTLLQEYRNGKVVFCAIQPEMKEALALMRKWFADGIIDPEFITGENTSGHWSISNAFANGRIGFTGSNGVAYHWNPPLVAGDKGSRNHQAIKAVNPAATYAFGPAPIGSAGRGGVVEWPNVGEAFVITSRGAKDPRKTRIVLSMLNDTYKDPQWSIFLNWGLKDVHYTVNADGVFLPTAKVPNSAESRKQGLQVLSFMGGSTAVQTNPPLDTFQEKVYRALKSYSTPTFPTGDATTKYTANLQRLTIEAYMRILTGNEPIERFDDFVKEFRANGGDMIEAETTLAYNKLIGK